MYLLLIALFVLTCNCACNPNTPECKCIGTFTDTYNTIKNDINDYIQFDTFLAYSSSKCSDLGPIYKTIYLDELKKIP